MQNTNSQKEANPLLCDPKEGTCEIPSDSTLDETQVEMKSDIKPIKVVYFTDPICSSCWGIEPQLRRMKLEYGEYLEIEYRMGGLLPDWSYNSGGISKPSDVAGHWDEVSPHYQMPIDGDIWLEDPLDSSYPPSIAFKSAQIQSKEKAQAFMRTIREMVFLRKKNITKWEHLSEAAKQVGLDVAKFKSDYEGIAKMHFQADLELGRKMKVRGFPTLFLSNADGDNLTIYGFRPYGQFEMAIQSLFPDAKPKAYSKSAKDLLVKFGSLTAKELSVLVDISFDEAKNQLNQLVEERVAERFETKNGAIWKLKFIK